MLPRQLCSRLSHNGGMRGSYNAGKDGERTGRIDRQSAPNRVASARPRLHNFRMMKPFQGVVRQKTAAQPLMIQRTVATPGVAAQGMRHG